MTAREPRTTNVTENGRSIEYTFVASVEEFEKAGRQLARWVNEAHDVLVYEHDGQLMAVSNICRHFGGPVGYHKARGGTFTCLWHNWQYSCRDGSCLTVPNLPLRRYPVRVVDRLIYVDLLG
jgi:nitrite reductase/ring-hydroxylating ferredoxin subunit